MMKRLLTLPLFALLLTGCGLFQKTQKSEPVEVPAEVAVPPRRLSPESKVLTDRDVVRKPPAEVSAQAAPLVQPDRPVMTFSVVESSDVRVPGVNPLPACGLLVLPLATLEEEFCYPYHGKYISAFGPRNGSYHTGMDIKAVPGDTVRAALPGVVRMSKPYSGYGNIVVIRHYCGIETVYAHNERNLVAVNDVVEAGQPIGLAGRTGRATTEHLHFEVRAAGEPIDPVRMVDPETMQLRFDTLYIQLFGGKVFAYNSTEEGARMAEKMLNGSSARATSVESPASVAAGMPVSTMPPAYGAEAPAVAASSVPAAGSQSAAAVSSGAAEYHRVQSGDTLSAIGRKYGTTVDALCRLNNLTRTSILQLNQRIRVK